MLVSFNWLKQYIDLPDSLTPEELALKLTMSTVEVEKIFKQGEFLDGIVVGQILSVQKHPNADKLSIAKVDVGEEKPRQIIFGQMVKMEAGFKIPVALAPTVLPGNKKIDKAKMRGETSEGMLCLDQEMGLAKEGVSIRFFDKEVKNGTPIIKALGLDDVIFEIDNKSLSNRPDLWGHYGMAREVAALFVRKLKDYKIKNSKIGTGRDLSVRVEDKKLCPRYMAVAIEGIKIASSPDWLQKKLLAVGLRPINNIVDITNYVMLDLGQPMHALDAFRIKNSKHETLNSKFTIIVRRASGGEKFTTLDEKELVLASDNLVIATEEKAIALAGVMGGLDSGINDNTTAVVFESANFDASSIRKTSTRFGLRTDSSARFEKSLDPNNCELALRKAIELTLELCPGAKIASKIVDAKDFHLQQGPIELPMEFLSKKIGVEINKKEVIKILINLGFEVKEKKGVLLVKIPTWRATKDISIAEDLVEEVARIYGYGNIPASLPKFSIVPPQRNELRTLERKIKKILALEFNFSEVSNYSFVSPELLRRLELPMESFVELDNPIAKDRPFLRRGLWPGLLENAEANLHRFDAVKMFEIGRVFNSEIAGLRVSGNSDELLPGQPLYLGLVFASKGVSMPFYELSEALAGVFDRLGCKAEFKPATHKLGEVIHSNRQAQILVNGEGMGAITEITPSFSERLGINERAAVAEVDLEKLLSVLKDSLRYKSLPIYPEVIRDIAFVVDKKVEHASVVSEIKKVDNLIVDVELFDVYDPSAGPTCSPLGGAQGKILEGKKSLAYHITYRSDKKTLESSEVDVAHDSVGEALKKMFGIEIRK